MKTLLLIVVVMIAATTLVTAQTTAKIELNMDGKIKYDIFACDDDNFLFACVTNKDWSQIYAGKVLRPAKWLEIGLGAGIEEAPNPWRVGGWVWAGEGKATTLWLLEDGGSGFWYEVSASYQIDSRLKAGVINRKFYGQGVTAEYKLGNEKIIGALYEGGKATVAYSHSF